MEKPSQGNPTENSEKIKLPEFNFDDPHTRLWIENQLAEHRKVNSAFSLKDLVNLVSQKITILSKDDIIIEDDELFVVNGKACAMAPDLKGLSEIDYDDPNAQKWMAEREAESIRLYGKLTYDEANYMYARRLVLEKQFPEKSVIELNQIALAEYRAEKKSG